MNMLVSRTYYTEDDFMYKISKVDDFNLVVKAMDHGDINTANEILRIISKSIRKETVNSFSSVLEIKEKKDEKCIKKYLVNK